VPATGYSSIECLWARAVPPDRPAKAQQGSLNCGNFHAAARNSTQTECLNTFEFFEPVAKLVPRNGKQYGGTRLVSSASGQCLSHKRRLDLLEICSLFR